MFNDSVKFRLCRFFLVSVGMGIMVFGMFMFLWFDSGLLLIMCVMMVVGLVVFMVRWILLLLSNSDCFGVVVVYSFGCGRCICVIFFGVGLWLSIK